MKNLILSVITAILFSSCAAAPILVTLGTANGLQYGIKDPVQRKAVATQIVNYTTMAQSFAKVPDPVEFRAELDQLLPNNDSKELTLMNMTSIYGLVYPTLKDKEPVKQLGEFKVYLEQVKAGAQPFL